MGLLLCCTAVNVRVNFTMEKGDREGEPLKESSESTKPSAVEDAPDPEEDDLNDLDGKCALRNTPTDSRTNRNARYAR